MRTLSILFFWLAGFCTLAAQGYYIKDYEVTLDLNDEAALQVTERIHVYFEEKRRGIIRSIPYEGSGALPQSGEVAWRAQYGDRYAIHLEDITVDSHPFTTYSQDSYQLIRIGDPDIFLTGDQHYTIRYTVYGAVQEFADHAELPWNVIGNEWDTRIEKGSFTLTYPGRQRISDADFLAVTGYRGSTQRALTLQKHSGSITGQTTSALQPGQGISVALRLPKTLFKTLNIPAALITRNYVVESLNTQLALQPDGAIRVTERILINALNSSSRFLRMLSLPPGTDVHGNTVYPFIEDLSVRINTLSQGQYRVSLYPSREQTLLEVIPNAAFSGRYEIRLDYTVWGAATAQDDNLLLRWNIFHTYAPEPVEYYKLTLALPQGYALTGVQLPYPPQVRDQLADVRQLDRGYTIESRKRVLAGRDLNINMSVNGDKSILGNLPRKAYAKEYWIDHLDKTLTVEKDGSIAIRGNYYPRFRYREGTSSFHLKVPLGVKRTPDGSPFFSGHNILGRKDRYFYRFTDLDKLEAGEIEHPFRRLQIAPGIPAEEADFLSVNYVVKGVLNTEGNRSTIWYPVWIPVGEPLRAATIKLDFEKQPAPDEVNGYIVTESGTIVDALEYTGSAWEGYIPDERYSDQRLYAEVSFPANVAPGHHFFAGVALFWLNNKPLVLSVAVFLFLLLLWRLIGKDTPGTIIARFKPPENMPPSEAGFIWDGKLHHHDMTALIYYWGAQGSLKIREMEGEKKKKPEFEFVKLRDLPQGAREYERIFFDGLFADGDRVKLSSLKNSFYKTYNAARKEFSRFERKAGYYARGTRGFGKILAVLGWLIGLVIAIPLLIYSVFVSDYTYSIPALIVAVSLIVFGRIMPRMKKWAQEALDELAGFREFIRAAETERLKTLVDEDPHYFGMTLPYAVVMGEGKRWAEKFEDLSIGPPDYYEGYGQAFSPWYFTHHMIHSMHDMKSTFTSTPAPSSGSGSSWGGGSSFGGGFSGGGGFGGGGGSSW